jgi:hypothetical protein
VKTERKTENFSLKRDTQKRSTKVGEGGAMLSPKVHAEDAREILFSKYLKLSIKNNLAAFQNCSTEYSYICAFTFIKMKRKENVIFDFFFEERKQ